MKEPSISFMSVLLLLGAVQNIILALALIGVHKGSKLANRILAVLLLVFSLSLIDGFLLETNYYFKYPSLIGLEWPCGFLYGPLAFFYVRALTSPKGFALRWEHLLHLIPFGIHIIILTPFYLIPADEKGRLLELIISLMDKERDFNVDPMFLILVIQVAIYLIVSLRLIVAYSSKLKQNFSSVEKINLAWLRDLFVAFFCLWCVFSLTSAFAPRYGVYRKAAYFMQLMNAVVIFVMGMKGIRRPQVFMRLEALSAAEDIQAGSNVDLAISMSLDESQTIADNTEKEKYRKSSLTDEQSAKILHQLTQLMETDRPFLEPELTLPELSDRLSVSPNHVSQVINGVLKKNFFDFVNEYRVRESKKLLITPQYSHFSILGIAMEAGFNSQNAFYSAFKKHTGMTPSQFRKQKRSLAPSEEPVFPARR
jgi:AraC-like DNA-binding protein